MKWYARLGKLRSLAVVAIAMALLLPAMVILAATVSIDDFGSGSQLARASGVLTPVERFVAITGSLGTERDLQSNWVSGSATEYEITTRVITSTGTLSLAADPSVKGTVLVQWDGIDGSMTLNPTGISPAVDITDSSSNTGLVLRIIVNDIPAAITLRAYTDGTNWSSYTFNTPGNIETGEAVDIFIPFSSFTASGGAGANFASIGAFEMFIDATLTEATDLILDFLEANNVRDFGDLPSGYPVTLVENGARHIPSGLRLGKNLDTEVDGPHSVNATGDDTTGVPDDEDGVAPVAAWKWTPAAGGEISVTVQGCTGTCYFNGWIDFDNNGNFSDGGDQIFTDYAISNGSNQVLTFTVPSSVSSATLNARFRICANESTCNTVTGEAGTGEVEDYQWSFGPNAVSLSGLQASPAAALPLLPLGLAALTGLGAAAALWARRRR